MSFLSAAEVKPTHHPLEFSTQGDRSDIPAPAVLWGAGTALTSGQRQRCQAPADGSCLFCSSPSAWEGAALRSFNKLLLAQNRCWGPGVAVLLSPGQGCAGGQLRGCRWRLGLRGAVTLPAACHQADGSGCPQVHAGNASGNLD